MDPRKKKNAAANRAILRPNLSETKAADMAPKKHPETYHNQYHGLSSEWYKGSQLTCLEHRNNPPLEIGIVLGHGRTVKTERVLERCAWKLEDAS
jgi:hypothetical protein